MSLFELLDPRALDGIRGGQNVYFKAVPHQEAGEGPDGKALLLPSGPTQGLICKSSPDVTAKLPDGTVLTNGYKCFPDTSFVDVQ